MMAGAGDYVRYKPPYAVLTPSLISLLAERHVGRNGWAVMTALCMGVHVNGVFDRKPSKQVCKQTGLSAKQVSRGMEELKELGIIVPVIRKTGTGARRPDRSCFGHVAQYCFSKDAWSLISSDFDLGADEDKGESTES